MVKTDDGGRSSVMWRCWETGSGVVWWGSESHTCDLLVIVVGEVGEGREVQNGA